MKLALIFTVILGQVWNQNTTPDVIDIWKNLLESTPATTTTECIPGTCIPGFSLITPQTTQSSIGHIEKCGEDRTKGKWLCVCYDFCDRDAKTVLPIRNRIGEVDVSENNLKCGQSLNVCCQIPSGGFPQGLQPNDTRCLPPGSNTETPTASFNRCGIRNQNGVAFKTNENNNNFAQYGEFPWMVALIKKNFNPSSGGRFFFCGGSLINPSVVLTVAHCVSNWTSTPGEIKVRVGEWDKKVTNEKFPYQERNVVNIIINNDYKPKIFNDIALLILDRPVDKAEHIDTICLPDQGQVIESGDCFVSGWGTTVEGENFDILKKIQLPVVPDRQCEQYLRNNVLGRFFKLHDSLICAGGEEGKDSCHGDGGSPLVCPDPNNSGRYLLAGMVVAGLNCGDARVPSVYTKVAKFRSWIDQQMAIQNLDTNLYRL